MVAVNREKQAALSWEELHQLLHYNLLTGVWRWRPGSIQGGKGTGKGGRNRRGVAGCVGSDGYREITVNGRSYLAQLLAWFYVTGEWPKDRIDHINRERDDNRFRNLREATHQQNMQNRKAHTNNTSGTTGVSWVTRDRVWRAEIGDECIGYFKSKKDAIAARRAREPEVFGEYAPAN